MHASGGGTATISAGGTITARGFPSGAGSIESAEAFGIPTIHVSELDVREVSFPDTTPPAEVTTAAPTEAKPGRFGRIVDTVIGSLIVAILLDVFAPARHVLREFVRHLLH